VDLESVWDFLAYRYVPGPRTLFASIRKLPPATCATWERGKLRLRRYWTAPDRNPRQEPAQAHGEKALTQAFLGRLDEAVKLQMVSDVPFGAFLPGGLDSSSIVALMTRHNGNVKTFSVGFGEGGYSELEYAGVVARHFGTTHHELIVKFDDIVENLPKLVGYRDAPVSEPSDIPIYLLAKEASRTVKMVLTGEGSDELLGGYPKHVFERFASGYQLLPGAIRHNLIAPITHALPYGFRRAKTAIANFNIDDWRARIQAAVKSRVVLPPNIEGNPEARFEVVLLPGGEVLSATLKKSSGHAAYDAAVERAINRASPLPVPNDTDLFQENFRELNLVFRPKDKD